MDTQSLQALIDAAFERRADLGPASMPADLSEALDHVLAELEAGRLRVAEKVGGAWLTHEWLKKAVLLYFRTHDNRMIADGPFAYFDKVPTRFRGYTDERFRQEGFRVVPPE
ncbi:MAG: 2,3,4,5-tetrahydropyridine-2,6-dicarboxylate N-succinyltransferase, partial [Vicinamibacterales bacterium]